MRRPRSCAHLVFALQLPHTCLEVRLALLRLQRLADAKRNRTFVQGLRSAGAVGTALTSRPRPLRSRARASAATGAPRTGGCLIRDDRHPQLVPHAQQEQAALGAVDGDLADQLVCAGRRGGIRHHSVVRGASGLDGQQWSACVGAGDSAAKTQTGAGGVAVQRGSAPKHCAYSSSRTGQMPVSRACATRARRDGACLLVDGGIRTLNACARARAPDAAAVAGRAAPAG